MNLIPAVHNLLAEYGLCCVGKDRKGFDGTSLNIAIKHLLTLDMTLKSNDRSFSKDAGEGLLNAIDGAISESSEKAAPANASSVANEHGKHRESCRGQ